MVCGLRYTRGGVCGLILDKEQHEDCVGDYYKTSIFYYFHFVNPFKKKGRLRLSPLAPHVNGRLGYHKIILL